MRRIASMAQGYQICHCEERSDVAISQNPTGQQGIFGENAAACTKLPPPLQGLAMTRQVVPRCTSALTQLNGPVQGGR